MKSCWFAAVVMKSVQLFRREKSNKVKSSSADGSSPLSVTQQIDSQPAADHCSIEAHNSLCVCVIVMATNTAST